MLTEQEALSLYNELMVLKDNKILYNRKWNEIYKKFQYCIEMNLKNYRRFHNYEDLKQEGYIALLNAFNTFKPEKGNIFFWIHNYVSLKIARKAGDWNVIYVPIRKCKDVKMSTVSDEKLSGFSAKANDVFEENDIIDKITLTKIANEIEKKSIKTDKLMINSFRHLKNEYNHI